MAVSLMVCKLSSATTKRQRIGRRPFRSVRVLQAGGRAARRASRKPSGIQGPASSGTPMKSVTKSAVEALPRIDTTTDLVRWSRTTMYGSAPSACAPAPPAAQQS